MFHSNILWAIDYGSLVINRVIHAPKEHLTPFDLRADIYRINVKLSAYYRAQKNRKNVRQWLFSSDSTSATSHVIFGVSYFWRYNVYISDIFWTYSQKISLITWISLVITFHSLTAPPFEHLFEINSQKDFCDFMFAMNIWAKVEMLTGIGQYDNSPSRWVIDVGDRCEFTRLRTNEWWK